MRKFSLELRITVLVVVTVVAVIATGYLSYRSLSYIVHSIHQELSPDWQLLRLKEIRSSLAEAENNIRLYTLTDDEEYLDTYQKQIKSVDEQLNLLYLSKGFEDKNESFIIDTISSLIEDKLILWEEMITLETDLDNESVVNRIFTKLEGDQTERQQDAIINQDTTEIEKKEEKTGFFQRLFKGKREIQRKEELNNQSDNVFDKVRFKQDIQQLAKEQESKERKINWQESELIKKDKQLSDQIELLVSGMENRENLRMVQKTQEADRLARRTYLWITLFCISATFLLLTVLLTMIRYVRKSRETTKTLNTARLEAEQLSKTKELFMANVTHELRTPMNAIFGLTEQLSQHKHKKEDEELISIIKKSTDHLISVINDILDFSKLEAGKLTIEKKAFSPMKIIREAFDLNHHFAIEKGIEYQLDFENEISDVLVGDPKRLKQIIINLVHNAIKFTPEGKVNVAVNTEKEGQHVNLEIKIIDTGIGIDEEKLQSIFDDFSQAHSSNEKFGGTGLGLSIVKKIIELQQGVIRVESKKSQGTIFVCSLPYEVGSLEDIMDNSSLELIVTDELRSLNYLIADDELYNRIVIKKIFDKWGIAYEEASNGEEAVEKSREKNFDVVLMDLRMPVMDGYDASRIILNEYNEKGKAFHIIAITATNSENESYLLKEAGIDHSLLKPFSEEQLLSLLMEVIEPQPEMDEELKYNNEIKSVEDDLDLSELKRLGNNDPAFINEMLHVFIDSSIKSMEQIKIHVEDKNWDMVADYAHKIASPCRHMKAMELLDLVKRIQHIAEQKLDTGSLPALVEEAEKKLSGFINLINEYLKSNEIK